MNFLKKESNKDSQYLRGKKNLSIEFVASDEMYDFIQYCISYGVYISDKNRPIEEQAKNAYHHFKSTVLSQTLIESARILKKQMMELFSKATFVAVAIDEGSIFGVKSVDFNIENPTLPYKPFPVTSLTMEDQTAAGYVTIIYDALCAMKLYKVNVGTCICDGNKAQKKAFSFDWRESLRFKDPWLKGIIFIPCLCHRINNAYKYHSSHDEALIPIVEGIKNYPQVLNEHRNEIEARCPSAISTRWILDYDILNFITQHEEKTREYLTLSSEELNLKDILFVFKSLIGIFENPNTYFHRAFFYIERAIMALEELGRKGNPYAEGFKNSLLNYTLKSEDGGLWVLGYILTRQGQQDFRERIQSGNLTYVGEGLSFFQKRKQKGSIDPLNQAINELVEELELKETNAIHEEHNEPEPEPEPEEEDREDLFRALQIAAFGRVEEDVPEREEREEREEIESNNQNIVDENFVSILDSAKKTLRSILINNEKYSAKFVDTMMRLDI